MSPSSRLFAIRPAGSRWPATMLLFGLTMAAIVSGVSYWKRLPPG